VLCTLCRKQELSEEPGWLPVPWHPTSAGMLQAAPGIWVHRSRTVGLIWLFQTSQAGAISDSNAEIVAWKSEHMVEFPSTADG